MAMSRRRFLALSGAAAAAGAVGATGLGGVLPGLGGSLAGADPSSSTSPTAEQLAALEVLGKDPSAFRVPGSLYNPGQPVGFEDPALAGIENIVILMMENHSFDNFFGMLGRGNGFTLGPGGLPNATNPYANGNIQEAFHMPTTCQLSGQPTQEWEQGHIQYDNGANDGFVISGSGPVAMGYWDGSDLPFTYGLASLFPIGDQWFCSVLGQTDPNRMYLFAGTSMGLTDDFSGNPATAQQQVETWPQPPNGTIFNALSAAGITWKDYTAAGYPPAGASVLEAVEYLEGATPILWFDDAQYYVNLAALEQGTVEILKTHYAPVGATTDPANNVTGTFFADAAAGTLPQVSMIDPNYITSSQENPQNIVNGEAFLASIVDAIGSSPQWSTTMLIVTYDEWGGYFDHVPPPVAMEPDDVPPSFGTNPAGEQAYDGFARYGFRVPSLVVSPYAKTDYVSSVVYDHTSVLALIERKWNLPALTYRDANANDLTDFIDFGALSAQTQNFTPQEVANLQAPGNTPAALACSTNGPGTIPPPGSVIPGSNLPETTFVPALALTAAAAGAAAIVHQRRKAAQTVEAQIVEE